MAKAAKINPFIFSDTAVHLKRFDDAMNAANDAEKVILLREMSDWLASLSQNCYQQANDLEDQIRAALTARMNKKVPEVPGINVPAEEQQGARQTRTRRQRSIVSQTELTRALEADMKPKRKRRSDAGKPRKKKP